MNMDVIQISAIGEDSHRFDFVNVKQLILGGVCINYPYGLLANSDGDVILHAVTNAVSGLTGINILGSRTDELCLGEGIKDSCVYLIEALKHLHDVTLTHLSISIECSEPKLSNYIPMIKTSLSGLLSLSVQQVGITATTGEGLTSFGRGEGIKVTCILSAVKTV